MISWWLLRRLIAYYIFVFIVLIGMAMALGIFIAGMIRLYS